MMRDNDDCHVADDSRAAILALYSKLKRDPHSYEGIPNIPVEWGPREPHFTVRMGTRDPHSHGIPKIL